MIIEEKKAQSFRFTKMTKKDPFLPTLNEKKNFDKFGSIDAQEKFLECKKKYFILFPDRAFENQKRFDYINSASAYFAK